MRPQRPGPASLADAGPPFARNVIALAPEAFETIRRTVAALFHLAHTPAFQQRVDGDAGETARHDAGNFGVFMGYDFHVTPDGPRLIEVNTNAGGALLNGLHTASLVAPERLACLCENLLPVAAIEERIVAAFRAELAAARPGTALRRLAIVDEHPETQFLRAEFGLVQALLERHGVEAAIADTAELRRSAGRLVLEGRAVDLVYLRDTDFQLRAPRTRALREAWLAGEVALTPSPREHHLLADKRRLTLFSSPEALRSLGAPEEDAKLLAEVVPETRELAALDPDEAWRERRRWVFKPAASFGSRAVYRGDKISRRKLEEIYRQGGFVAQRLVAPGEVSVASDEGWTRMKSDVRAYAYRDEILLLGARVYRGQVTNLRTHGGGFSAICVVRRAG